jgi:hypothetical protein
MGSWALLATTRRPWGRGTRAGIEGKSRMILKKRRHLSLTGVESYFWTPYDTMGEEPTANPWVVDWVDMHRWGRVVWVSLIKFWVGWDWKIKLIKFGLGWIWGGFSPISRPSATAPIQYRVEKSAAVRSGKLNGIVEVATGIRESWWMKLIRDGLYGMMGQLVRVESRRG